MKSTLLICALFCGLKAWAQADPMIKVNQTCNEEFRAKNKLTQFNRGDLAKLDIKGQAVSWIVLKTCDHLLVKDIYLGKSKLASWKDFCPKFTNPTRQSCLKDYIARQTFMFSTDLTVLPLLGFQVASQEPTQGMREASYHMVELMVLSWERFDHSKNPMWSSDAAKTREGKSLYRTEKEAMINGIEKLYQTLNGNLDRGIASKPFTGAPPISNSDFEELRLRLLKARERIKSQFKI